MIVFSLQILHSFFNLEIYSVIIPLFSAVCTTFPALGHWSQDQYAFLPFNPECHCRSRRRPHEHSRCRVRICLNDQPEQVRRYRRGNRDGSSVENGLNIDLSDISGQPMSQHIHNDALRNSGTKGKPHKITD